MTIYQLQDQIRVLRDIVYQQWENQAPEDIPKAMGVPFQFNPSWKPLSNHKRLQRLVIPDWEVDISFHEDEPEKAMEAIKSYLSSPQQPFA